ncbi:MAG: hypothetical protein HYV26_20610, partial [Candidatus Hydrogenedentes bacterium]|nr:hypothetical protein [Candidatus Hydrogenedentota bacterium]
MLATWLCFIAAALPPDQILVSTDLVATLENALLVDARPAEAFATEHLPGAANLDVESLSETRRGVVGLLKLPEELRKLLAAAGLSPARHIVVYSGMQQAADVKAATRLFWMLENCGYPRVSLLNGGFAKWKAEGKPVETGPSKVVALDVESIDLNKFNATRADRADVLQLIEHHTGTLLDLRVPEEYAGISKKDFVDTAGHIPSAQSCPAGDFVQGPYFEFKTAGDLAKVLGEVDLKKGGP